MEGDATLKARRAWAVLVRGTTRGASDDHSARAGARDECVPGR